MEQIITGRFQTRDSADAAAALIVQYIASSDMAFADKLPPGSHDAGSASGSDDGAADADGAGASALGTALAAGLTAGAIGTIGGPVVALAAAGTGAYLGSLAGALAGLEDHNEAPHAPEQRPGAVMLSVRVENAANEPRVIASMRAEGGRDIGQTRGEWPAFNPVTASQSLPSGTN